MGQRRELFGSRKDGSTFPIEVGLAPVGSGQQLRVICTVLDRTEVVGARRELENKAQALDRSNQELEQFAYAASHDLKEPLRTISGFLDLLDETDGARLSEEGRNFLATAVGGARRMRTMIERLLSLSRVTTAGAALVPVPCSDALEDALSGLQPLIEDAGAEVLHAPLPEVAGDIVQLELVFQNLIENAIKYRSDRPLVVRIEHELKADEVEIRVIDNGLGFDPRRAHEIFQPFRRLHAKHRDGSGLGLSIAHKIIERHRGRIWAESVPGQGTRLCFTLPLVGTAC